MILFIFRLGFSSWYVLFSSLSNIFRVWGGVFCLVFVMFIDWWHVLKRKELLVFPWLLSSNSNVIRQKYIALSQNKINNYEGQEAVSAFQIK